MTTVNITTPNGTKLFGIYDATPEPAEDRTWTQCDISNAPTHNAIMDEVPLVAGTYSGTVYADGEGFYAPDTEETIPAEFTPAIEGAISGLLTVDGATATTDGAMSGTGYLATILRTVLGIDLALDIDNEFDLIVDEIAKDYKQTDEFDTLIYTLIFTDARATRYQVENSLERRGWLGDLEQKIFRSRVWLKDQARKTDSDLAELTAYVKQALGYMVENKICDSVEVESIMNDALNEIGCNVYISIGNDTIKKYVPIWRSGVL
jgi:phage gp46-like protein